MLKLTTLLISLLLSTNLMAQTLKNENINVEKQGLAKTEIKRDTIFLLDYHYFDEKSGQYVLNEAGENGIQKWNNLLNFNKNILLIKVTVWSDAHGTIEQNKYVTSKKAEAIVEFLKDIGVKSETFVAVGAGESQLNSTCDKNYILKNYNEAKLKECLVISRKITIEYIEEKVVQ